MTTDSTLSGLVLGMDEEAYHAHPAFSSTQARTILASPAKYQYGLTHAEPSTRAFDLGTAVHSKVLGTGSETVVIPEELLASNGAASTTAAKEFIENARAAGQTPVKQAVFDEITAMTESLLAHPMARVLLEQEGESEASVFATDPDTGIATRARFDYLPTAGDTRVGVDLKTARDASPFGFASAAANHGYHIQRGHYLDAHRHAGLEPLEGFVFVVAEIEPPYLVGVYRLNRDWEEIGVARARQARALLRECLDTDVWPGYGDGISSLMAPFWLLADAQEVPVV